MENTDKIGGVSIICLKSSFQSPILLSYQVIGPSNLKKMHSSTKLHFSLFFSILFFFLWRREGVIRFRLRERKLLLVKISATKTVNFCVKWFHMMKVVKNKCSFTLKTPKNIFEHQNIFGFGSIVLCFQRLQIDLTRFLGCFLYVLGKKQMKIGFLDKTNKTCFSNHTNGQNPVIDR